MMNHQPTALSKNKEIGCSGKRRVKARLVEYGDVLCAGDPGKVLINMDPNIGRSCSQFLTAFKNHFPTVTDAVPTRQQIPSRVYATHPLFVRPNFIHSLE